MEAALGKEIEFHWGNISQQEGKGENEDKSDMDFQAS